jgi:hypothetical protein
MDSFHQFLKQPAFGVCRGVLLRDSLLLLFYSAWGIVCLAAGYQGQGLVYIWEPFVVMPLLIWLRRELLPRAIAQAYDILKSDIRECLTADGFRQLVRVFFDHVMGVIKWVATSIAAVFFFVVRFLFCVLAPLASSVRARARFAWESTSFRRSLFLTHSHTLRAPPALA